ncbi:MAG: helix-turn-helix transcriptional regulator [Phenylobacterium sp.]|uniref:helix-turn-helix domain-containing protein n=1 Tax=Phenylobacterium sp. TaxID=1871053 RepID=UPI0027182DE7|nr:helix-turn-helix transcriptional regulator [Phenylobacterium sp.]MDO8900560.1 helix-turn-helix transcriptional regulator [Phenylobacterium sp.]
MALDTGRVGDLNVSFEGSRATIIDSYMPTLDSGPNIGAALKAAREFRGLSLQDVADSTRIRRAYLAAIEEMRIEDLPSRPFTIGYVRAYARALGLEAEAAVSRFKAEEPATDDDLREPVGVRRTGDRRLGVAIVAGILVISATVAWNFAQRGIQDAQAPAAPVAAASPEQVAPPIEPQGPLALGAPLPAPVESTIPKLYETPGLDVAAAAGGSADAVIASNAARARNVQVAAAPTDLPAVFKADGEVYGAPPATAAVVLQARESAALIVRGADGSVYFARQLAAGEAYGAPQMRGLIIDVSEPSAFQVFVGGETRGLLPANQTPVSRLAD